MTGRRVLPRAPRPSPPSTLRRMQSLMTTTPTRTPRSTSRRQVFSGTIRTKTAPVAVGVIATDPSNVVSVTCNEGSVSVNGLGTTTASGSVTVTGEGTHNLNCKATDSLGNGPGAAPGSVNTGIVKIDTVPPV